jgi:hypothetical protein
VDNGGERWWQRPRTVRAVAHGGALCRVRVSGVRCGDDEDTPVRFLTIEEVVGAAVGGGAARWWWRRLGLRWGAGDEQGRKGWSHRAEERLMVRRRRTSGWRRTSRK